VQLDKKLEEFLSINSMNLTSGVREFIERSRQGPLSDEEAISSLGLIAFERKKFLKSIQAIENRFQRRLKQMSKLATDKAKQGVELIVKQCRQLFKFEWHHILKQYKRMRNALYTAEHSLFLSEAQKAYLEVEFTALKTFIASTSNNTTLPHTSLGNSLANHDSSLLRSRARALDADHKLVGPLKPHLENFPTDAGGKMKSTLGILAANAVLE